MSGLEFASDRFSLHPLSRADISALLRQWDDWCRAHSWNCASSLACELFGRSPTPLNSWVYFVQAGEGGPIKIGVALDPDKRLSSLQIGNSVELRGMVAIPGDQRLERLLHTALKRFAVRGEWFAPDGALLKLVELVQWSRRGALPGESVA